MQATLPSRVRLARPALNSNRCRRAAGNRLRVSALAIPDEYGWVLASVAVTAAVTQWQAIRVVLARKECGVKYPKMYADGDDELANKFNCTQRAHQNTCETLPNVLALQLGLGLAHPKAAAVLGFIWSVGRIVYTLGYSTGDPSKRTPGSAIAGLAYLGFIISTAVVGLRTALGV